MSLINDALKKAQNRQGDSTPPPPGTTGPAAIPSAPRKGKTPFAKIVLICAGIAALSAAVSAAVIFLLMRRDTPASVAPSPISKGAGSPVQATSATTATPPAPVRATDAQSAPISQPVAPTTDLHTPVVAGQPQASPITPSVAQPIISAPPPEPSPPAIKLGTRVQAFIDRLRVTSIRISDTGNKAILNDRLFRVNDLVEPSLGLRLTGIEPKQLTFTDETGTTYLRHF